MHRMRRMKVRGRGRGMPRPYDCDGGPIVPLSAGVYVLHDEQTRFPGADRG